MSIQDFEDFLAADPEWSRLNSLTSETNKVRCREAEAVSKAEREYEKWMCCEGALEWFNMDLTDSGDLGFTGLNHELVGEYLADGQQMFERMKRAALVKAGRHAELWIEACEKHEKLSTALQKRRHELYDMHRQPKDQRQAAQFPGSMHYGPPSK